MMLPFKKHIEAAVLGCWLMIEETQLLISHGYDGLFYDPFHAAVWKRIEELYKSGGKIDLLTVMVSGLDPHKLAQLTSNVVSSANQEFHLRLLEQSHKQRQILEFSHKLINDPKNYDENADFADMISEISTMTEKVMDLKSWQVGTLEDATDRALELLDQEIDNPSGWGVYDKIMGGFKKQDFVLIAGRPAMGKTALALSLALAHERAGGKPAFISLEMPSHAIAARRLAIISGIDLSLIINKELTEWQRSQLINAAMDLKTKIFIDDTPGMTIYDIGSKIKQMVKHEQVTTVFIDYIQLIKSAEKNSSREQEVAKISSGLKLLARQQNICIVGLAQLNRAVEGRGDKRPGLSDLRDSGQLEQDADVVLFPYRPAYYKREAVDSFDEIENTELIIAKNRNGKTGIIGGEDKDYFQFDPKLTQYKFK